MHRRPLGSTGRSVLPVGLGCMGFTHAYDVRDRDDDRSVATVHRAVDEKTLAERGITGTNITSAPDRSLLEELGALAASAGRQRLTPLGRRLARLPIDPRLGRMVLEAEGYKTQTYNDGASALDGFAESPPDLAILDIKMPRMDGMELLRRLRQRSELPVIFLTSKDEEIDELFGLKMGADDFIRKPFPQRLLVERVKAVLRRAAPRRLFGETRTHRLAAPGADPPQRHAIRRSRAGARREAAPRGEGRCEHDDRAGIPPLPQPQTRRA